LGSASVLWLTAVTGQATVTDAPHNDTNGITCTSCHRYSLWWQYSPAQQQPEFASLVDTLCADCHKDGGTGPKVFTHSSAVVDTGNHGVWGRACTACHDPHYQGQLDWATSVPSPYLATGTMTTVAYDGVAKQTTITYDLPTPNPAWPAVGEQADSRDWANKSLANPGRGLILVQDSVKTTNTFPIVSASATEVVVKGEITADMINPAYIDPVSHKQNSTTCASFGLIYGDLIRSSINSRSVKFFDPNGFVHDEGATPTGICQVCHTQTAHYKNDGVMPDVTDSHLDRNTMNCTTCHQHQKGFKGTGHDNTSFAWAGNCATCHNPTGAAINITDVIHGKKCGLCHVSAGGGGPRREGDAANGIDGSAIGATNLSTCVDCHLNALGLTAPVIHHVSANGYAASGDCTHCHADAFGHLVAPHNTVVAEDADCASCHTATAGLATGMRVNPADSKVHDACLTCHGTDGNLLAPYGQAIAIPPGGATCKTCHGADYFLSHLNKNDHSGQVDKEVANCTSACHFHDKPDTIVDIHQNNCSHCHDLANGGVKISLAALYGPGNCANCHRDIAEDPMAHPKAMTHVGQVDREPTCLNTTGCHPGSTIQVHQNNCANCHAWNWGLRTNFDPARAFDITPGNCLGCHQQTAVDSHNLPCPQTLGEALDAPGLTWETSSTWTPVCTVAQSGKGSAQSLAATTSTLQTTVTGEGTLTFYWKIEAAGDTTLQFAVDGVQATTEIGPLVDWQLVTVPVTGLVAHTLTWTYNHPSAQSDGPGYVDHVVWTPAP